MLVFYINVFSKLDASHVYLNKTKIASYFTHQEVILSDNQPLQLTPCTN